jgi:phage shock protein A
MSWIDRALAALRRTVRDLISEEDIPEDDRVNALLAAARVRIDALRIELDEATAREKRAELEWRATQTEVSTLNDEADAALRAGRDAEARQGLARIQAAQQRAERLSERRRDYAQVADRLHQEVRRLELQLDDLDAQVSQLTDRERNTAALEQLNRLRRDLRAFATTTRSELAEREEHIARREDHLAAREDIEQLRRES